MTATATPDIDGVISKFEAAVGKRLDEFSAEQKSTIEKLVKDEVEKCAKASEAERAKHSLPGSDEAKHKGRKYSFARAMAAIAANDFSQAGLEKEMHDALKSKAMSFGTDTAGGFLVPNEIMLSEIIPLLYAESCAMALGATQLSGLTRAPVQLPRVSGGTTAYWVGEASTITDSSMALQQLSLSPHGLAALTIVSDLLQIVESPGVEAMIRSDMVRQLALKLDLGILAGSGAGGQPIGILNTSGVNTSTLTDPTTYDELLDFVSHVREDNALSGRLGWAVSNPDMLELEQTKDVTGGTDNKSNIQPLGSRLLLTGDAANRRLLEYPVKVCTQLTDGQVIFGNWADVIVAQWGGMRLDMTNALGFATAQSHIRALTYVDVGVRHPVSFCIPA